ncbi:MAG: histidine kinase dimerization/phospho-acceptor domain-containing protein [Longimicrobiales bacterium]
MTEPATDRRVMRPNRASVRLASGAAHQINNILTVVGGHASVLLEDLPADHPARPSIEAISQASHSGTALTNQLLAYSGQLENNPVEVELHGLLTQSTASLDLDAPGSWATDLPRVVVDPSRFAEVMNSIATFGRRLLKGRGQIGLSTGLGRGGDRVFVRLVVNGPDLEPFVHGHAFEPFGTTAFVEQADGMLLPAAWGTVRQWGGNLWVEPGPDGLTFAFSVPVVG